MQSYLCLFGWNWNVEQASDSHPAPRHSWRRPEASDKEARSKGCAATRTGVHVRK